MKLKMGDLVLRKDESTPIAFRITEFDGDYVILRGIKIPVITVARKENLIRLNRRRNTNQQCLRRVK